MVGPNLSWAPTRPINFVQAGRMLSVALRTHSDEFKAQLEQLRIARWRTNAFSEASMLSQKIGTTTSDGSFCARTRQASDILDSAVISATVWHQNLKIQEAKSVLEGRTRQKAELTLFRAIQKSIETGCNAQLTTDQRDTYTRGGAWLGFFEGLRAGRHSAELIKSTMNRGCRVSSSAQHGSASDRSGSSRSDSDRDSGGGARKRRKKGERHDHSSRKTDGDGKGGARNKLSGARCKFQVHFPSSKSILGPKLGVECSTAGPCRHCSKTGH